MQELQTETGRRRTVVRWRMARARDSRRGSWPQIIAAVRVRTTGKIGWLLVVARAPPPHAWLRRDGLGDKLARPSTVAGRPPPRSPACSPEPAPSPTLFSSYPS